MWWILLLFIFLFVCWTYSNNNKRSSAPTKPSNSKFRSPYSTKSISASEFDNIFAQYITSLKHAQNNAESIEHLAHSLEEKFNLNERLYAAILYINNSVRYQPYKIKLDDWWPNKILDSENIRYDYGDLFLTIGSLKISYTESQNETYDPLRTERSEFDTPDYDYDRNITIEHYNKKVYSVAGYDYGLNQKPILNIPNKIYLKLFKPSKWLLEIHEWLLKFEENKSEIDSALEKIKRISAANLAKEKYSPA